MSEKIIRATLDTTVILGAVGNSSGPNASIIAHGIAGVYTMGLAQSVIAEALRHLRNGFGKVPPLSDRQMDPLFATLFQHLWNPLRLVPAPPTTLNTAAIQQNCWDAGSFRKAISHRKLHGD